MKLYKHLPLRNMERNLTLPRRILLNLRPAGGLCSGLVGVSTRSSTRPWPGVSTTRILLMSSEVDLMSFRFRVVTSDIIVAGEGMQAADMHAGEAVGVECRIAMRAGPRGEPVECKTWRADDELR